MYNFHQIGHTINNQWAYYTRTPTDKAMLFGYFDQLTIQNYCDIIFVQNQARGDFV
jgi:hypothetical protein